MQVPLTLMMAELTARDAVLGSLKKGKLAFFLGSGISVNRPTNFPEGARVVRELLKHLEAAFDFTSMIGEARDKLSYGDMIRFETLMDVVAEHLDPELTLLDRLLPHTAQPNPHHLMLAELSLFGCPIFTTNFDDMLERASRALGFEPRSYVSADDFRTFLSETSGSGIGSPAPIFHLHGLLAPEHRSDLKATLGEIELGLEMGKREVLESFLATHNVVFLGYSGWDDFDLNPIFHSSSFQGLWVDHHRSDVGADQTSDGSENEGTVPLEPDIEGDEVRASDTGWRRIVKFKARLRTLPGLRVCQTDTSPFLRSLHVRLPAGTASVRETKALAPARPDFDLSGTLFHKALEGTHGAADLVAGRLLQKIGRHAKASVLLGRAVTELRGCALKAGNGGSLLADAYHYHGVALFYMNEFENAESAHRRSRELKGGAMEEIRFLHQMGNLYYAAGENGEGWRNYGDALNLYYLKELALVEKLDQRPQRKLTTKAKTLHQIALAYAGWSESIRNERRSIADQQMGSAFMNAFDALEVSREAGSFQCEAEANALIGTLYLMSSGGSEAFRHFTAARESFEVLGENLNLGMVYQNLGALHWKWGDRQDAHDYWYRALKLYRRLDYQKGVSDVEYELFKRR